MMGQTVTNGERDRLAGLIRSFPGVFSQGYSDIGCYKGEPIDLELKPGASPQFVKPYPVPWAKEERLKEQLDELQACGVIAEGEPADWNSPVLLIPKPGSPGEERIVQDMRSINQCLLPKKFVFPNIDEFLHNLGGWKVASSLDIRHAFWNLRLSEASSRICAFHAVGTTWYPQRMPMGCQQSSFFLHRVMHRVLGDIPGVFIYADDVLLTSVDMNEHYRLLHTVFDRLNQACLKLSPEKCKLGMTQLSYLGHLVTPGGISIEPDRISCIKDLQPPSSVKETKRLYGFFSWFRKFIPGFAELSAPLVELANADKFYWGDEQAHSFESLREALLSDRVLAYPSKAENDRFVLYTDSSTVGSGQVLCQIQNGAEQVIAFSGSKYNKHQRKWTIYELEVYSFIQGLHKFYKYLAGQEFTGVCDCKSALQILKNRDDVNPRLMRWRSFVSQFQYTPEHRRAKFMEHVDMLSRAPDMPEDNQEQQSLLEFSEVVACIPEAAGQSDARVSCEATVSPIGGHIATSRPQDARSERRETPVPQQTEATQPLAHHSSQGEVRMTDNTPQSNVNLLESGPVKPTFSREEIIWYQKHDRDCRAIVHHLRFGKWPSRCSPALKRHDVAKFVLKDGILHRYDDTPGDSRIVWPLAKRFELLSQNHDPAHHGHCGEGKLFEKLSRYVWYPKLRSDCHEYVRSCERCSQRKDTRGVPPPPLIPQAASLPNEVLVVDVVHMPKSRTTGISLVLTCVDKFTGYLSFYPLQSGSADELVNALQNHFLIYGPPKRLETDAGTNFKSSKMSELCRFFGAKLVAGVGYHHEAIGKVERKHLDVKRRLRALSDSHGVDWEAHLPGIVFSLNNEVSRVTGYSPYFLYFWRHPNTPLSELVNVPVPLYSDNFVHEKLRMLSRDLRRAQDQQRTSGAVDKAAYDRRKQAKELLYVPGDRMRVRNFKHTAGQSRKMEHPWSRVHTVITMVGRRHVDYMDGDTGAVRRTHVKFTKPVYDLEP